MESVINQCISDDWLHVRLLNTFSLIENVGAQRIHRFQRFGFRDESILRHAFEEARHAYFFKKLAGKLANRTGTAVDSPPFCISSSRNLLRKIDLAVNQLLTDSGYKATTKFCLCYLIVTLLIEERALSIYKYYEESLRKSGKPLSIASVIAEESGHTNDLVAKLDELIPKEKAKLLELLHPAEEAIFEDWILKVSRQVGSVSKAEKGV